jgi:hypothetical protein
MIEEDGKSRSSEDLDVKTARDCKRIMQATLEEGETGGYGMSVAVSRSGVIAYSMVEEIVKLTENFILERRVKANVPIKVTDDSIPLLDLFVQAGTEGLSDYPETDDEFHHEPVFYDKKVSMVIDSWAKCRVEISKTPGINLDISFAREEPATNRSFRRSTTNILRLPTQLEKIDSNTSFTSDSQRLLMFWKNKAKEFITSYKDEDMPEIVPLKQILDRPSTAEQKVRTLKEQQVFKEKQKLKEEQLKKATQEADKKFSKHRGSLYYDYEGKAFELPQKKQREKPTVLLTGIQ